MKRSWAPGSTPCVRWRPTITSLRAAICLAVLLPGVLFTAPAMPADEVKVAEVVEYGTERAGDDTILYALAVLNGAGWEKSRVNEAIRRVEAVFSRCGVTVTAGTVYRLDAPPGFLDLEEPMQSSLLAALPAPRPIALLVDQTTDGDVAYSYLSSAPVASRGTAWVTRNSRPACLPTLLAHELGHILLDTPRHVDDPNNLMSHTCTVSNLAGDRPGTHLNESQCEAIRKR